MMTMYSIMIVRVMKRMMAKRFLGVVQWNMRRFWVCVVICFPCFGCFVCSCGVDVDICFVVLSVLLVVVVLLVWRVFSKVFSQIS